MKLSELIARYGDDKVKFQPLDQCVISLDMTKKGTTIAFRTDQPFDINGTRQLGLVVWLDRGRVAAIVAASKEEQKS